MSYLKAKVFVYDLFGGNFYTSKNATQQNIFLSKYPSYDGRGIKIAIIDSGIDVSLEGLQKTSEGLPKIIDCFDFTGAGDVDTSVIKEMDSKNYLTGLSGRKFKIPKNWINPSGKWHLGLKALYKPNNAKIPEKLPEIDCIVWFDGQKWCVCIETFKPNLQKSKVLTNFRDFHEYGTFLLKGFEIVYSVTVHNNGNLLEIFTPNMDSGSNCAQIVGAHFPKKPEHDGLAPGAQIISMSVLCPATQYSVNLEHLKKALLKCIEMEVDIISYSSSFFGGDEEIEKLIKEMCNNYNILIFKSAGNGGPFYSTVSKFDKNIETSIFTIGAVLTSDVLRKAYHAKINDSNPPLPVVYASKGPGAFGSRGVDFAAPADVITKVSKICFRNWFRGSEYSSANAAGAVACLLSGLKANSIQYSPASIKFALFKTAFLPENGNIFEFGHGIIQINSAFEYFCKSKIDFKNIPSQNLSKAEGILFLPHDGQDPGVMEHSANLSNFINLENDATTTKLTLEVTPKSKNFIEVSKIDGNNLFFVKVDTTKFEAGSIKDAEIMIMDPLIGSILNIPIFVFNPLKITEKQNLSFQKEIILCYERPYRIRLYSEIAAKKCEIKITALKSYVTNLWIKYVFPLSMSVNQANKTEKNFIFSPFNQTKIYSFLIKEKEVFEICFYQNIRGNLSTGKFNLEFYFKNND